jgi:hypothetical protein
MTANQSRLLGVALLLAAVSAVIQLARGGDTADGVTERRTAGDASAGKQRTDQSDARAKARLEHGAYILRSKRISDAETIETIIVPESLSDEFDTRCIVYQNADLRTSSITCTGVLYRPPVPPS